MAQEPQRRRRREKAVYDAERDEQQREDEKPPIGQVEDPSDEATLLETVSDPASRRARSEGLSTFVPTSGLGGFPDDLEGAAREEVEGELVKLGQDLRADVEEAVEKRVAEALEELDQTGKKPQGFVYGSIFGAIVFAAGAVVALALTGGRRRD